MIDGCGIEVGAGNSGHANFADHPFTKFHVTFPSELGYVHHDVVGTLGCVVLEFGTIAEMSIPIRVAATVARTNVTYISAGAEKSTPSEGKSTLMPITSMSRKHCTSANRPSTTTLETM